MSSGEPTMGRPKSEPNLSGRAAIQGQIRSLVTTAVKTRTGPSFEERLADAVAVKNKEMKESERSQWKRIHDCVDHGRAKSANSSPLKGLAGMDSIKSIQNAKFAEREKAVNAQARQYWTERKAMLDKIRNREPLFRLTEVAAAQEQIKAQAEKRKQELRDDERKRWEALEEIQKSVLNRPLLMD
jgi:hypothetical protein